MLSGSPEKSCEMGLGYKLMCIALFSSHCQYTEPYKNGHVKIGKLTTFMAIGTIYRNTNPNIFYLTYKGKLRGWFYPYLEEDHFIVPVEIQG